MAWISPLLLFGYKVLGFILPRIRARILQASDCTSGVCCLTIIG